MTQLIDEPINTIAKQVKDYEEEQRKKKKEEILAYMKEAFTELPETVASKLKSKIYDSKWENKSTTKKTWQTAVNTALENTKGDLNILDGIEEDFKKCQPYLIHNPCQKGRTAAGAKESTEACHFCRT